tara:strand:+ start:236 stop:775 length:540 start_codon:yes stop_codon:yes gene_type:complete
MRVDKRRNEVRILASAAELFSTVGPDAVSIDDIARHAGVSRATVYNHYEDRGLMVESLLVPALRFAVDRQRRILAQERVSLRDVTNALEAVFREHHDVLALVDCSYAARSEQIRDLHAEYMDLLRETFRRLDATSPLPLGVDGSLRLLGTLYLEILRLIDRGEIPAVRFHEIVKGALLI